MSRLKANRKASCHSDRPYYAKDMCKQCYQKHKWHNDPSYRASRLRKERNWYHVPANKEKRKAHSKAWYLANKDKARAYKLKYSYGLTPEEYQEMYDTQDGLCAICHESPIECVDHDHSTNKVRGLLCSRCNLCLGHYEVLKKRQLLDSVDQYLEFLR